MAAASDKTKYPQKLIDHLKKLSHEKEDLCEMFKEWDFCETIDSGNADNSCPCGKTGIRYLCKIQNRMTKSKTSVGTTRVEFFDDQMKEVLSLALNLISCGISGKYKGKESKGEKERKERFEVRANTNLVTKEEHLKALFKHVPIYKKRNGKWEIKAFNNAAYKDLTVDATYSMKIRSSRWDMPYGTGISFRITKIDLKN